MVISHILGGIGNQMFQYAAGRALALANDQQHLLDLSGFSNYRLHHGFELSRVFNVNVERVEPTTVNEMLGWRANRLIKRVLRRPQFVWLRGKRFVVEPHFNYWPEFFNLTGDCYLYGYWQSERYFKSFENIIRRDFTFREPLGALNSELALQIVDTQSVSLHVRRGDYVTNTKNSYIGVCSLAYYQTAIEYILSVVDNPNFFVFSDDIDWVKANLIIDLPSTFIDHNVNKESYNDMRLMSLCKHHIIANSSFSWWGAWLNPNPDKTVIAPRQWFSGMDAADLTPSSWLKL